MELNSGFKLQTEIQTETKSKYKTLKCLRGRNTQPERNKQMRGQRKYRTINTHTALTPDRRLTGEVTTAGK